MQNEVLDGPSGHRWLLILCSQLSPLTKHRFQGMLTRDDDFSLNFYRVQNFCFSSWGTEDVPWGESPYCWPISWLFLDGIDYPHGVHTTFILRAPPPQRPSRVTEVSPWIRYMSCLPLRPGQQWQPWVMQQSMTSTESSRKCRECWLVQGEAAGRSLSQSLADEVLANQKKVSKLTLLLLLEKSVWRGLWDWTMPWSDTASTTQTHNRVERISP